MFCSLSFTVDSAVLSIRYNHKLWSYIYMCIYIKLIFIICSIEGAEHTFWFWWWKEEINLQSVWLQFLCMSTQSQGYEICCLSLCSHSASRGWISPPPSSLLFSSPLRLGWPFLQHTTRAQLTLKHWVSPQTGFEVNPFSTWAVQTLWC